MTAGTTIAIVAPNVVAATAIVVGWFQHRGTLGKQRELADLSSVRVVLDDAAIALHTTAYELDTVRANLTEYGAGYFKSDDRVESYERLKAAGRDLDALLERLRVRFGREHEVAIAFAAADAAVLEIFRAVDRLKLERPAEAGNQYARAQVQALRDRTTETVKSERATFDARRTEFIDAAEHTGGARLPGPRGDR